MSSKRSRPKPSRPSTATAAARSVLVVVDDEPLLLRSLKRSLAPSFEVAVYETAEEAMARLRAGGVSIVLSDLSMPGMSGLELLRAVKEYDPDLPVILTSGATELEIGAKALECGAFRYLPKPFEAHELVPLVRQALVLYRLAKLRRDE
jgi:two-component system C4-dicarboxylate transport response regulator DctD